MSTENLQPEVRATIAREFKIEPEMEELLARVEKDQTVLNSLNSTHRIAVGMYSRNKRIAREYNQRRGKR
jgi:hypothetical protein